MITMVTPDGAGRFWLSRKTQEWEGTNKEEVRILQEMNPFNPSWENGIFYLDSWVLRIAEKYGWRTEGDPEKHEYAEEEPIF